MGYRIEDLGSTLCLPVDFPACQAVVDYPAQGYDRLMGWVQVVWSGPPGDVAGGFGLWAAFAGLDLPYRWFGSAPELFDAPFCGDRIVEDDDSAWWVTCVNLRREARGRGIGVALLKAATGYAQRHVASVLDGHPVDVEKLQSRPSPSALFTAFERFSEPSKRTLPLAEEEAERSQHSYIDTEHLLIALLRNEEGIAHPILVAGLG